jgi:hypothetical protein
MKGRLGAVLASLALVALLATSPAAANGHPGPPVAAVDHLGPPVATAIGSFGGIAYVQYDGTFEGMTSTGAYRVPYRITAPADPKLGNRTVLMEPPHAVTGLDALGTWLGRDFLFSRGFAHAGIGWSTSLFVPGGPDMSFRILDPTAPGVFIEGGFDDAGGRTDDEIIAEFASALARDSRARQMLGRVDRRYLTGFSDSSDPVLRLVSSGRAAGVFDLVVPFTAPAHDPQTALAAGLDGGKLIIVNSEFEARVAASFVDRGGLPNQYRFYAVAGTPHIPDFWVPGVASMTTPASWQPALRAHFLQGHDWAEEGKHPPPSTHLKTSDNGTLDRDANGNAIAVDAKGKTVPRLPFVELGEARFIVVAPESDGEIPFEDFLGSYDGVKTIADLGFKSHDEYIQAFERKAADYVKAGYMLDEDAKVMVRRAALCAPLTFTETYRDHYDAFTSIIPCN